MKTADIRTSSTLTCPRCGDRETEIMPADACQYFYDCKGCGAVLKPTAGDCCVFCSYGDVACPPIQAGNDGGRRCCP
ncbi:MAG TPA: GDCCVxC domain-containing (seleno)protein [Caulobacteraceae bacterium]|nr:GDCCVxC domain-containing (seleno)protein [Caulobacteraceae bacterium]